jgi:nicotinic acid mononucleotide adenylyltransferase
LIPFITGIWLPPVVASQFGLDEVVFADRPAVAKADRRVSAAEDRHLMTVIATASNPRFTVSRVDRPAGMTYQSTRCVIFARNGARTRISTSSPAPTPWLRS